MIEPVKGRTEAGRRREQRAHRTRARVVDAALRLFVEHGYLATTVEGIAREAGVAPATIYQAFGSKQAVLARVLDARITGDAASVALLDRDWVNQARREPNAKARLAAVVHRAAEVAARTTPLKEVMRDAAATDDRVRKLIHDDDERRRQTQRALVEIAIGHDTLRAGMTVERAADTFFMLVNSSNYSIARRALAWDETEWQNWLLDTLTYEFFGHCAT